MQLKIVEGKKEKKQFLAFRKKKYKSEARYIDNNYFMIEEIFGGKLHFTKGLKITPVMVLDDNGDVMCEAVIAFAPLLPEYVQVCFFEALEGCRDAVEFMLGHADRLGREYGCKRIVIGLAGHVNYGLGFLASRYEKVNSFSSPGNAAYYNDYFAKLGCRTIKLNSYYAETLDHKLDRYSAIISKLRRKYEFRTFDKRQFEFYSKAYTDLNNACFSEHRYYYHRDYEDDMEMLKELFLFINEDSVYFAFDGDRPVGFILWYPDYNELAKPGESFGTKHFFLNKLKGKNIKTVKVMEWGVLDEYRGCGLPVALVDCVYRTLSNYNCSFMESSWILEENEDSTSICEMITDGLYKQYAVYEKEIG